MDNSLILAEKKITLEKLETLFHIPEMERGFNSKQACLSWCSKAAPLLKLVNGSLYVNFMNNMQYLNVGLVQPMVASAFDAMKSQVEMAIEELKLAIEREEKRQNDVAPRPEKPRETSGSDSSGAAVPNSPKPPEQKPGRWKRLGLWVLLTVIIGWMISPVITGWAVYWFGPQGRWFRPKQIASIEFENTKPFVDGAVFGVDWAKKYWNVRYFKVQIYNKSDSSTIRARYIELTELRQLEEGIFKPWDNTEPVPLQWDARSKDIPPRGRVLVSFARIYPPELQSETDKLLSGDLNIPQLRFTVDGWPRRMTSHVPPGTHQFKLTVYFENEPPAEAEFELQWSGNHRESLESMVQEIKFRKLKD